MFVYKSDVTIEWNKAFLAFQQAMLSDKDAVVTLTQGARNKYAKLEALYLLVAPFLNKVGLTIEQPKTSINGQIYCMTVITHVSSDQFKRSYDLLYPEEYLIAEANSQLAAGGVQQTKGTVETYVCRRAIEHMLCLPLRSDDFDDKEQPIINSSDNKSDKEPVKTFAAPKKEYPKDTSGKYIDQDQNKELFRLSGYNKDNMKILRDQLGGVVHSEKILAEDFDKAVDMLAVITGAKPDKTKEKVDIIKKSFPKAELVDKLPF